MYLEQSLLDVSNELNSRGWRTKSWNTRKESVRGGRLFDKNALHQLLTNVTYISQVRYKDEVHAGEHQAIVVEEVFKRVQAQLERNGRSGGRGVRNKHGALLRGLLHCKSCKCGMSHSYTTRGKREYRYYVCNRAQKRGWQTCPTPSLPAAEIERFVINEMKTLCRDPQLVVDTLQQARSQRDSQVHNLQAERGNLLQRLRDDHSDLAQMATSTQADAAKLANIHEHIQNAEQRLSLINGELAALDQEVLNSDDVASALAEFEGVWDCLAPREQSRIVELLVERVSYDGHAGSVVINFRPS